jgi:hypothetical protein
MKKFFQQINPAEFGAGLGLTFVCVVCILVDTKNPEIYFPLMLTGLMISTGLLSSKGKKTNCIKQKKLNIKNNEIV